MVSFLLTLVMPSSILIKRRDLYIRAMAAMYEEDHSDPMSYFQLMGMFFDLLIDFVY